MKLQPIDIFIIGLYLVAMIVIGLVLKKRASKNMDSYFLGGKTLPFYMLGLSNASGQFDISGTMWMVTLAFIYGIKSAWVPWLWPVFNQIFLMVYLSVWLRRSNVLTGAEWIQTRFGKNKGASLSHTIVVIYALIGVLGFLSYGLSAWVNLWRYSSRGILFPSMSRLIYRLNTCRMLTVYSLQLSPRSM